MDSPFDILGIDPDAADDEVEDAYRRRVKEAHPDHGGSVREFQAVRRAYERIIDGESEFRDGFDYAPATGRRNGAAADGPTADAATNGPTADAATNGESEAEGDEAEPEPEGNRVEYLNYDVLDDHGWDIGDDDLFEKAADADLSHEDYGAFFVGEKETLLEAAENHGFTWPFACRGGACSNCAVAVVDGEMPKPTGHILPSDLMDRGIRLSCLGAPITEDAKVLFNIKHLPGVDELRLPAGPFKKASSDD